MARLLAGSSEPQPGGNQPAAVMAAVQDLPAWLLAAMTALRWLPMVAAFAAPEGQALQEPAAQQLQRQAAHVVSPAVHLAQNVGFNSFVCVWQASQAAGGEPSMQPAIRSDCLAAWCEFHTASCRLVHWSLAGGLPVALQTSLGALPLQLARLLERQVQAAAAVLQLGVAHAPPDLTRLVWIHWLRQDMSNGTSMAACPAAPCMGQPSTPCFAALAPGAFKPWQRLMLRR